MKSRNTNRRRQELTVHFVRWAVVTELRARRKELLLCGDDRGSSWERCYAAVSDAQANTPAAGSEATVKASYQHIQRLIRAGRGAAIFELERRSLGGGPQYPRSARHHFGQAALTTTRVGRHIAPF